MKLLLAALLAVTVPSAVQPTTEVSSQEECQGRAATITGSPGEAVSGTTGADVIVSNGAETVDAISGSLPVRGTTG